MLSCSQHEKQEGSIMNTYVTGSTIRLLREAKGLTQA